MYSVTIPYWDWTDDSKDDVLASVQDMDPNTKDRDNGIIPDAFRCWIDEAAVERLRAQVPPDVLARLDRIAAQVPFRPFEEPMILPLNRPDDYHWPGLANLGAGAPVGKMKGEEEGEVKKRAGQSGT